MKENFNRILTAFHFDGTQLTVHWKVLQIHWTASRDGQSEKIINK